MTHPAPATSIDETQIGRRLSAFEIVKGSWPFLFWIAVFVAAAWYDRPAPEQLHMLRTVFHLPADAALSRVDTHTRGSINERPWIKARAKLTDAQFNQYVAILENPEVSPTGLAHQASSHSAQWMQTTTDVVIVRDKFPSGKVRPVWRNGPSARPVMHTVPSCTAHPPPESERGYLCANATLIYETKTLEMYVSMVEPADKAP